MPESAKFGSGSSTGRSVRGDRIRNSGRPSGVAIALSRGHSSPGGGGSTGLAPVVALHSPTSPTGCSELPKISGSLLIGSEIGSACEWMFLIVLMPSGLPPAGTMPS